jgi:hypothetical protein
MEGMMSLTEAEAKQWIMKAAEGLSREIYGFTDLSECSEVVKIRIQVEVKVKSNESLRVSKTYEAVSYEPAF